MWAQTSSILASWLVLSVAFWVASSLLAGVQIPSARDAVVVGAVFGLVNLLIGKLLFFLLGLATAGLLWFLAFIGRCLATAIMLKVTGALTPRLTIRGARSAIACALVMSVVGTGLQFVMGLG